MGAKRGRIFSPEMTQQTVSNEVPAIKGQETVGLALPITLPALGGANSGFARKDEERVEDEKVDQQSGPRENSARRRRKE